MASRFTFTIEVEVERVQGLFASKDELHDQIADWLDSANEGSIQTDADAEYEVTSWEVSG